MEAGVRPANAKYDYGRAGSGLVTAGSGEKDFICDINPAILNTDHWDYVVGHCSDS